MLLQTFWLPPIGESSNQNVLVGAKFSRRGPWGRCSAAWVPILPVHKCRLLPCSTAAQGARNCSEARQLRGTQRSVFGLGCSALAAPRAPCSAAHDVSGWRRGRGGKYPRPPGGYLHLHRGTSTGGYLHQLRLCAHAQGPIKAKGKLMPRETRGTHRSEPSRAAAPSPTRTQCIARRPREGRACGT